MTMLNIIKVFQAGSNKMTVKYNDVYGIKNVFIRNNVSKICKQINIYKYLWMLHNNK